MKSTGLKSSWWQAGLLALAMSVQVPARVNVVTLPGRDSVQLTVYNSVDLTLVKETRYLTFRQGLNRLEFSWANTLIDPTSVELRAVTHADEVDVLDVRFPPRVTNTLEWRIQSEYAGEIQVEIRYFTSGISWTADYTVETDQREKTMNLAGQVRINNQSGEDYENAQVRLIVGVVRLVEKIADLASPERQSSRAYKAKDALSRQREVAKEFFAIDSLQLRGAFGGRGGGGGGSQPAEIAKESLSEYFLYTVGGWHPLPNGWVKRLPSCAAREVPLTSYYKYEKEAWGNDVQRLFRFKNDAPSHLGKEPLPDGQVYAFRLMNADGFYSFTGNTSVKYIPMNEQVDLELGVDTEVRIAPKMTNWIKKDLRFDGNGNVAGWTIVETWQMEYQNSKDIAATIDVRRNFTGDWTLATKAEYEKVDANKVKFVRQLKPREKGVIEYEVTSRFGLNATR